MAHAVRLSFFLVACGIGLLISDGVAADRQALQATILSADRLVVTSGPESTLPVYSSTAQEDVEALSRAALIDPLRGSVDCACRGSARIRLYQGDTELLSITNHHGRHVEISSWPSGACLKEPDLWVAWFSDRGILGPKSELEAERQRRVTQEENERRWLAAMPPPLRSPWSESKVASLSMDVAPLQRALEAAEPDPYSRILQLLEWYGSGAGKWSGFPAYEMHARALLLDHPLAQLVTAVETADLTQHQTEGAARLLSDHLFRSDARLDGAAIPPNLKSLLLRHTLSTGHAENMDIARAAFDGE